MHLIDETFEWVVQLPLMFDSSNVMGILPRVKEEIRHFHCILISICGKWTCYVTCIHRCTIYEKLNSCALVPLLPLDGVGNVLPVLLPNNMIVCLNVYILVVDPEHHLCISNVKGVHARTIRSVLVWSLISSEKCSLVSGIAFQEKFGCERMVQY